MKKYIFKFSFVALLLNFYFCRFALCQHNDRHLSEHVVNDSSILPEGLEFELLFAFDLMRNVKGGIKPGTAEMGDINLVSIVDLEKLKLINGGSILFYYLGNFGGYLSKSYVGDYQVSDNIETFSTTKLYEFWYQQNLFDNRVSIAAGIHDYNRDFDELRLGLFLIHSSFGLGPDISQVPPSNFPTTSLGSRIRVRPTEKTYLMAGAYDGTTSLPNQPGTRISLGRGDGVFTAYELGYMDENVPQYKKFSVGGWYNSRRYTDFSDTERDGNFGAYILTEGRIYSEHLNEEQGLGIFNAVGTAQKDRNQTDLYVGGGLTYVGLIPDRDEDIFSCGYAYAKNSTAFKELNQLKDHEIAFEVIYKIKIYNSFTVSPDLQYIVNPGMNPDLKNAHIIGMRFEFGI